MKKYFYILAALSIAPQFALAQSFDTEVDAEIDQIATQQANPSSSSRASVSQQPIYILNQGAPVATQTTTVQQPVTAQASQAQAVMAVQKQPTTMIEATPLTESRAEQIRKARQDAELQTEQKIVEKLEVSRMEDERKRASLLFGDKLNHQEQAAPAPVVQATPVPVQPIIVQAPAAPKEDTRDIVREEIRAAMKVEEETPLAPLETRYFGALAGIGDYPDVRNVRGNYSLGAQFGTVYDSSMIVEGTFMMSNYSVDQVAYYNYGTVAGTVDMNQYSGALAAKYQFLSGLIRPVLGGIAQYSYRTFAWSQNGYSYYSNNDTASSHAIDLGVNAGVDIAFSPKFSLGFDMRYMWNMSSRVNSSNNSNYWMPGYQVGTPVEKLQYYVMSLVGRVTF